ncbi:hypothetical protein FGF66_02585 [Chlorobaculum thiosulfatiphilum]|uniref:Zinc ribbon domain-containing protein n=1 Tax=Chlorobaculum thiosulfatiphilum TaxID=115852 RepID=A0A5C4S9J2_CHLTI|nr:hypothetical protein [Chlorobaculum thiosulfatiphilum]TNJ39837.1 hypothetical protein FGF66_02585 [Chlorobaculum thiosulfatiphilum]
MSLSTCRECGGQVSKSAKSCPHCGVPYPATSKRIRFASGIAVFFGILFIGLIFVGSCSSKQDHQPPASKEQTQVDSSKKSAEQDSIQREKEYHETIAAMIPNEFKWLLAYSDPSGNTAYVDLYSLKCVGNAIIHGTGTIEYWALKNFSDDESVNSDLKGVKSALMHYTVQLNYSPDLILWKADIGRFYSESDMKGRIVVELVNPFPASKHGMNAIDAATAGVAVKAGIVNYGWSFID